MKSWLLLGTNSSAPGMSYQCFTTELLQPDNHFAPQSSIHTAQVVLNASIAHSAGK